VKRKILTFKYLFKKIKIKYLLRGLEARRVNLRVKVKKSNLIVYRVRLKKKYHQKCLELRMIGIDLRKKFLVTQKKNSFKKIGYGKKL